MKANFHMNTTLLENNRTSHTDSIGCLLCGESRHVSWSRENGYTAVKCASCGLVYVNPRPAMSLISAGVETGVHNEVQHGRTAITYRAGRKVTLYKNIIASVFADVWEERSPIAWLDVGAGFGEIVEAVSTLAAPESTVEGVEPMRPKAEHAKARGLAVREGYLSDVDGQFDFLSLVNVFSHIPDFHGFLEDAKNALKPEGEIFIETGNIGDLVSHHQVPTDLDLPDHLVFAGEQNMRDFLTKAGFSIISIERRRKDGLINAAKNIVRKALGRHVTLAIPYTSAYRTLLIRAKLFPR